MPMNPGTKMMMLQRMTEKPQQRSEYGGNRRMIGYDRNEMTGGANRYEGNYDGGNRSEYNRGGYERNENAYRGGGYSEGNGGNRYERGGNRSEYGGNRSEYGGGNRYEYGGGTSNRYDDNYGGYEPPENRRRRRRRTGRFVRGTYGSGDEDEEEMEREYPPHMMYGSAYGDIYAKGTIYAPAAMNRRGGSEDYGEIDEHKARKWVEKMSEGEKFKMELSEQQRQAICPDCDKFEFYVAMNAMYSDYCKTAKKFNLDRPEFYGMLARDFLMDEDAAPHKLEKYMEHIPKK